MASSSDELIERARRISSRTTGISDRFDQACQNVGARALRNYRLNEAQRLFGEVHRAIEKGKPTMLGPELILVTGKTVMLVFLSKAVGGQGEAIVRVSAQESFSHSVSPTISRRRKFCLPEDRFRAFSDGLEQRIAEGAFDSLAIPYGQVGEFIFDQFKAASKGWMESRGWKDLAAKIEANGQ